MAKFRNVSVKFWSDPFIESLTPDKRYFYLYLFTNEHTTQCGIYEITLKQMADESGYKVPAIENLIEFFEKAGKIKYSRKTSEMAVRNFVKHNPQGSIKVKTFVDKELKNVKDRLLIAYVYATDTLSQEEQEEEETKEQEQEQEASADETPPLTVWPSFEDFWKLYDKNNARSKCEKKWEKIKQVAREKIMEHLALYVRATPDKTYRKNPETYLSKESWNDEIILPDEQPSNNRQDAITSLKATFAKRAMQGDNWKAFRYCFWYAALEDWTSDWTAEDSRND